MKSFLLDKKDSSLLAQDNDHPSKLGHAVWVDQMIPYIDTKILPKAPKGTLKETLSVISTSLPDSKKRCS